MSKQQKGFIEEIHCILNHRTGKRKIRYVSQFAAECARKWVVNGNLLESYFCSICGDWHLGSLIPKKLRKV